MMHFPLCGLFSTFSFSASAGERNEQPAGGKAQIIKRGDSPETVRNIPRAKPLPDIAEKGVHAE